MSTQNGETPRSNGDGISPAKTAKVQPHENYDDDFIGSRFIVTDGVRSRIVNSGVPLHPRERLVNLTPGWLFTIQDLTLTLALTPNPDPRGTLLVTPHRP